MRSDRLRRPGRCRSGLRRRWSAAYLAGHLALALFLALALLTPALAQDAPEQPAPPDDSAPSDMSAPSDTPAPADAMPPAPADQGQPAEPTPVPTPTPIPAPTPVPTPAPGQVLLADDFHDASSGVLPTSTDSGNAVITPLGSYSVGYVAGAYEIKKIQVSLTATGLVELPKSYSNVSVDVDAQLIASNPSTYIWVTCRRQVLNGSLSGYQVFVRPDNGSYHIDRLDSGSTFFLVGETSSDKLMRSPATNHLQVTCAGNSISLGVNGTVVRTVQDSTYATGTIRIGTGAPGNAPDTLRLTNLVVTQR